jgi:predicted nucleic acid-binding protein
MILVVADTSPLNYLVQIGCQELLTALYDRVLVPEAVIEELEHPQRSPYAPAFCPEPDSTMPIFC